MLQIKGSQHRKNARCDLQGPKAHLYFQIYLKTMKKHIPVVHIADVLNPSVVFCHSFPETSFIAVTAYQNTDVRHFGVLSNDTCSILVEDVSHHSRQCLEFLSLCKFD